MPRLKNEPSFSLDELQGAEIKDLIGISYDGDGDAIDMLFLRVNADEKWHRLFLDAGIGFWEKWTEKVAFEEFEDLQRVDYATKWKLANAVIVSADCKGTEWDKPGLSEFSIVTNRGVVNLKYSNPDDIESNTILCFKDIGSKQD